MTTIVRVVGYPSEESSFYVNDWITRSEYAEFTLPVNHPLANHLRQCHRRKIELIVADTEELHWHVEKATYERYQCTVRCISHLKLVKGSLLTDEYLIYSGMVS